MKLTPEQQKKQLYYRDARTGGYYDGIWKTVGKCVFCDLNEKYIVYEENGMVLVVALFAYIDGDTMIIPRRHVKSAKELTPGEWETTRKLMYIAKKLLRKVYGLQDVQYVLRDGGILVGSTVQGHFHMHCVPSDGPDLTVWNYRKLKYTPFENAELLRGQNKTTKRLAERFDQKYTEDAPDEL
nr:HIT domain protein [uncultured bacterium]